MIRRPTRSTLDRSSAASDVYKRQQLEVSTNETFPLNVALRTGVRSFYNIVEAGMRFDSDIPVWYFGYGIGTAANMGKKWQVDFDLTMSQPLQGNELNYFNPLTKLNVTFEKRFSKYFSLAAGPSLNVLASNLNDPTFNGCLLYTSPSPRDRTRSRMPSYA